MVCGFVFSGIVLSVGTSLTDDAGPISTIFPNIETAISGTEYEFYEVSGFLTNSSNQATNEPSVESEPVGNEPDTIETPSEKPTIESVMKRVSESISQADEARDEAIVPQPPSISLHTEGYALQVGSFKDSQHADSFKASLILKGYNAYSATVPVTPDDIRYRIIVGPYTTLQDAETTAAELKSQDISALLLVMRQKN